jgi:hypothetical protein
MAGESKEYDGIPPAKTVVSFAMLAEGG